MVKELKALAQMPFEPVQKVARGGMEGAEVEMRQQESREKKKLVRKRSDINEAKIDWCWHTENKSRLTVNRN